CTKRGRLRNPRVHVPGASTRRDSGAAVGPVRAGGSILRDAHGPAAFPFERSRYSPGTAAHGQGAEAERVARRLSPGRRTHRIASAGKGRSTPLPRRPPFARRTQGVAAVPALTGLG